MILLQLKLFTLHLLKAWPFFLIGCIYYLHSLALDHCTYYQAFLLNRIVNAGLQVVGIGIVLFSINSNLGLFKKKNLKEVLWAYGLGLVDSLIGRKIVLSSASIVTGEASSTATLTVTRPNASTEERLEALELQMGKLESMVHKNDQETNIRISQTAKELKGELERKTDLTHHLLSQATIGDLKPQVFGLLCIAYSAIMPFWT